MCDDEDAFEPEGPLGHDENFAEVYKVDPEQEKAIDELVKRTQELGLYDE